MVGKSCKIRTNIPVEVKEIGVKSSSDADGYYVLEFDTEKGKQYNIVVNS